MRRKCQVRKKNGARCEADAQTGKDLCVFHDPDKAGDVQRARHTGGITRSRRAAVLPSNTPDYPLVKSGDISSLLAESINQLRRGQLDPRVANAIGYLASVQLRSFEVGVFEERMAKVENSLGLIALSQIAHPEKEVTEKTDGID